MKKMKLWMIAAILTLCGATVLTACTSNEDNGGAKDDGKAKKALLIILDGWGIGDKGQDDAIAQTAQTAGPVWCSGANCATISWLTSTTAPSS